MDLSVGDLDRVRDYVGTVPDDQTLYLYADTAIHWQDVALRVLRRRRADASAGGQETTSFALEGVLRVGMSKADFKTLDALIADLEAQLVALTDEAPAGVTVAQIRRPDRYR